MIGQKEGITLLVTTYDLISFSKALLLLVDGLVERKHR